MRRTLLSLGTLSLLVLAGCAARSERLPPEEVLRRATRTAQELSSVVFDAEGTFRGQNLRGSLRSTGRLSEGGEQMAFTMDIQGDGLLLGEQGAAIQGKFEVVVMGGGEVYLRIDSLNIDPAYLVPAGLSEMFGERWWLLPEGVVQTESQSTITPDPLLLKAQAEIIEVTEDLGWDEISERKAYHYRVGIDRERLLFFLHTLAEAKGKSTDTLSTAAPFDVLDFSGELWIDAERFTIQRLSWDITQRGGGGTLGTVRMRFGDHGAAPPIVPPSDAVPFVDEILLRWLPALQKFPALPRDTNASPTDLEEELLEVVEGTEGEAP